MICWTLIRSGGLLTCAFISHQIFALWLIWVDGRDGDRVVSVRVQILQNMGGFVAIQDILVTGKNSTYICICVCLLLTRRCSWRYDVSLSKQKPTRLSAQWKRQLFRSKVKSVTWRKSLPLSATALFYVAILQSFIIHSLKLEPGTDFISFTDFCADVHVGPKNNFGGPKLEQWKTKGALLLLWLNWMFSLNLGSFEESVKP